MGEVSKSGRTILFVSHNMGVLQQLCNKAYLLERGTIPYSGNTEEVIKKYLTNHSTVNTVALIKKNGDAFIESIDLLDNTNQSANIFGHKNYFKLKIKISLAKKYNHLRVGFAVLDQDKSRIFTNEKEIDGNTHSEYEITIPGNFLVPGYYSIICALHIPNVAIIDSYEDILPFEIIDQGHSLSIYEGSDIGKVLIDCNWNLL
jgi:lipopolysaccharide transport system ATP-binding protein